MTKAIWQKHKEEKGPHDYATCPECKARLRTIRANQRAKEIRQVYSDLSLKRVQGALGGIYYE